LLKHDTQMKLGHDFQSLIETWLPVIVGTRFPNDVGSSSFVWSIFAGAITTAEGHTSSNITTMIEEQTNWRVQKFPRSVLRTLQWVNLVWRESLLIWKICHLPLLDLVIYQNVLIFPLLSVIINTVN